MRVDKAALSFVIWIRNSEGATKLKTELRKRLFGVILLFCFVLVAAGGVMADEPARVVIVPFKVNADRDLSFLKEGILDMLASRLSWENKVVVVAREETNEAIKDISVPLNEEIARTIGAKLGASHVLFGSLTMFGSSVSLDSKMVDVFQGRPTRTFFKQSKEIDDVIPQVNLLASEIQEKVFGRPVAVPKQVAQAQERPDIYAHPDKLLDQGIGDQAAVGGFVESGAVSQTETISKGFWKSQGFKAAINGIALGDVDGDGKAEVVFIDDRQVHVYRFENKRFLKIKEIAGKRNHRLIAVDAADINGNGYAEIFVTSLTTSGKSLNSFVLESDGDDFSRISEKDPWYYRVIEMPDQGKVLVGQKRRMNDPFVPGVYRLAWQNGKYESQERIRLPKGVNIFGFAMSDLMNNGQQMILAFDEGDHIRVFSPSGEEQWKSDEPYGGSMNYLESSSLSGRGEAAERLYLPQRIFVRDVNGDGKDEVIVASNEGPLARLFAHLRKFSSGRTVVLSWSGSEFVPRWQTAKMSGHVSDCAIGDFDHDGRDEVVAAHAAKQGTMVTAAKSSIVAYEFAQPESSAPQ
jgi:TolB-like protein